SSPCASFRPAVLPVLFSAPPPPPPLSPLPLHDALPISRGVGTQRVTSGCHVRIRGAVQPHVLGQGHHHPVDLGEHGVGPPPGCRSEEHTSELQSRFDLVCRLLLEKKKE